MTDKLPWMCSIDDCERKRTGSLDICETHRAAQAKEKMEESKPEKKFKPIKRRSDKRADQEREYNARVKKFIEGKMCAVFPAQKATQVHHIRGRENGMLLDEDYWLPTSQEGHDFIHANPIYSQKRGFMVLRSVTNKKTI